MEDGLRGRLASRRHAAPDARIYMTPRAPQALKHHASNAGTADAGWKASGQQTEPRGRFSPSRDA